MMAESLVLGIDGGATKTVAWLARLVPPGPLEVLGRGSAGPVNPQAVGFPTALENLGRAVDAAFESHGSPARAVAAAVLALAGSDREENRRALADWANGRRLADRFQVVHDAMPLLAAGTPDGWGIAMISGTGSFAFGRDSAGRATRSGGWGFLMGDEGSGYAIAIAALRAAAKAADGRGPQTQLVDALLARLNVSRPEALIGAVYAFAGDRARLAALSSLVSETAERGDPVAEEIFNDAARELALMAAAVARKLDLAGRPFPLALAGGVLLGSERLRRNLAGQLESCGLHAAPVQLVAEPVLGAVKLAAQSIGREGASRE